MRWTPELRKLMNIYPHKKEKEGLYGGDLFDDGRNVYFIDIEDGEKTRDDLFVGLPFKGSGST